jgi:hypothetical protein
MDWNKAVGTMQGIGPDGKPATFTFAIGRSFSWQCPDCEDYNGGGIINEEFTVEARMKDPSSPGNVPCVWCGRGPMKMVWDDDEIS